MVQSGTGILATNKNDEINQCGLTWKGEKNQAIEQYNSANPFLKKIINSNSERVCE